MGMPGNGDPGEGEPGGGANGTPAQERMALFTLRRPPVMGTFAKAGTASTLLKTTILNNVDAVPALANVTITGGRLNVNKAIRSCAGVPLAPPPGSPPPGSPLPGIPIPSVP